MRLRILIVLLAASIGSTLADPYVELDLDGVRGNGPDQGSASVGDTIQVNIWIYHTTAFCSVRIWLCSNCAILDQVDYQIGADQWIFPPDIQGDCAGLGFDDFFCDKNGMPPNRFAKVWYVVEACPCTLEVDDSQSYYLDGNWESGSFSGSLPVSLCEEPTEASPDSWGSIKVLFR